MARDDANKVRRLPYDWLDYLRGPYDRVVDQPLRIDPKEVPAYESPEE